MLLTLILPIQVYSADIKWTGTIRDFCSTGGLTSCPGITNHAHFQAPVGDDPGIVKDTLGPSKKPDYLPVNPNNTTTTPDQTSPYLWAGDLFYMWYRDTPAYNVSSTYQITLSNSIAFPNTYTYLNTSFFPIDGQLLGNQGMAHNFYFTYELHGTLQYNAGTSQVINVLGDDDIWFYINNKLAINLGGIHGAEPGSFNLDANAGSFGLVDGNTYDIDIFFAERRTNSSQFSVEFQNLFINPTPVPEPSTYLILGGMMLWLAVIILRKREINSL